MAEKRGVDEDADEGWWWQGGVALSEGPCGGGGADCSLSWAAEVSARALCVHAIASTQAALHAEELRSPSLPP